MQKDMQSPVVKTRSVQVICMDVFPLFPLEYLRKR